MCVSRASFWVVLFLATRCSFGADSFLLGVEKNASIATDVAILNNGPATASVTLAFIPAEGTPPQPVTQTAAPGQTLLLNDALGTLWNVTDARGVVRLSSEQALVVTATKYQQREGTGRQGATLPVVNEQDLLGAGERGDILWISESSVLPDLPNSTLWVFTPSANGDVEATIAAFDGSTRATVAVSGGPKAQEFRVGSLVTGEFPVGRARIQVRTGRAWAWTEVRSGANGDLAVATLAPERSQALDLTLLGAIKETNADGFVLQTNVRFFNPSSRVATITATVGTGTRTVLVGPNLIIGVTDIFGTGGPAGGPVRFRSNTPVVAMGRTIATSADGSVNGVGETHLANSFSSLISSGQSALMPGLGWDGARTFLVANAFENGATAQVILRDSSGTILASQQGYTLEPGASRRDELGDLFPGVSLPSGGSLELQVTSGSLLAGTVVTDNRSGDVFYYDAAVALTEACSVPEVEHVTASELTLDKPGPVTIDWNVRNTDSVDISPVALNRAAAGSYTATVSTPSQFVLRASNSCGSVSVPIQIAVGPPVVKTATMASAVPSQGRGSPGQLVLLQLDNLTEPESVTQVLWKAPNGDELYTPVAGSTAQGEIYTTVPLWTARDPQTGYRSGSFTVSAVFSGAGTNAIPFQIVPLTYAGDPVAGFTAWLDQVVAAATQTIADVRAIPGMAPLAAAQTSIQNSTVADLRKMAADIGARGSATLTFADKVSVATITREDLAMLLAYNANVVAGYRLAGSGNSAKSAGRFAGSCLQVSRPLVSACKKREETQKLLAPVEDWFDNLDIPVLDTLGAGATDDLVKKAVDALVKRAGLSALKSRLAVWDSYLDLFCLIAPIRLNNDSFFIDPKNIPQTSKSIPVKLYARLRPETTKDRLAQFLLDRETKWAVKQLTKDKKADTKTAEQIIKFIFSAGYSDLNAAISEVVRSLPTLGSKDDVQIGKCDLDKFYPFINGPDNTYRKRSIVIRTPDQGDGEDDWFMRGVRQGKDKLCIVPIVDHFLFSQALEKSYGSLYKQDCKFQVPAPVPLKSRSRSAGALGPVDVSYSDDISVGPAPGKVSLHDFALAAYLSDGSLGGLLTELLQENRDAVTRSNGFSRSASDGFTSSSIDLKQVDDQTWVGNLTASTHGSPGSPPHKGLMILMLDIVNPPTQDDTQQITISINQTNPTCSYYYYRVVSSTEARSFTAVDVQRPNPPAVLQETPGGRSAVILIGLRPGDNPGSGLSAPTGNNFDCSADLKITLRQDPAPSGAGPPP